MSSNCFRSLAVHASFARRVLMALASALVLQACGGGDSTATAAAEEGPPPPVASNHAPTIAGTPVTRVQSGQPYTFTPAAADSDGDALTFSVTNKPAWATFNSSTGRLSGTPPSAGTFAGIGISVSDGKETASLAPYTVTVSAAPSATTGSATLSWAPPTMRADGSTLTNLAGYKILYGSSLGDYTETIDVRNPGLASYVVESLSAGTYYFVVRAYDSSGLESSNSTAVSKTIS